MAEIGGLLPHTHRNTELGLSAFYLDFFFIPSKKRIKISWENIIFSDCYVAGCLSYKVLPFGCFFKVPFKGWHYFVISVIALMFSEVPPCFQLQYWE